MVRTDTDDNTTVCLLAHGGHIKTAARGDAALSEFLDKALTFLPVFGSLKPPHPPPSLSLKGNEAFWELWNNTTAADACGCTCCLHLHPPSVRPSRWTDGFD